MFSLKEIETKLSGIITVLLRIKIMKQETYSQNILIFSGIWKTVLQNNFLIINLILLVRFLLIFRWTTWLQEVFPRTGSNCGLDLADANS